MKRKEEILDTADQSPWKDPSAGNIPTDTDLVLKLIDVNDKTTVNVIATYNGEIGKFIVRGYHIDFAKEPYAYMVIPSLPKKGGRI
ncbi:MAG: hypothetical protein PUF37_00825 [Prevotellaceae bacterium]|nr:hypothetical protein [Prevotellaceae bacterium]